MAKAECYCEFCKASFDIVFEPLANTADYDDPEFDATDELVVEFCPFCGDEIDPSSVIYNE